MDTHPGTILGREPAMVLALVQAVLALVVAFGLSLSPDQIGAILAPASVARRQANSASRAPTSNRKIPNARCATSGGRDVPMRAPK
jgi:hypothetical protein